MVDANRNSRRHAVLSHDAHQLLEAYRDAVISEAAVKIDQHAAPLYAGCRHAADRQRDCAQNSLCTQASLVIDDMEPVVKDLFLDTVAVWAVFCIVAPWFSDESASGVREDRDVWR